jgi:chromosome partitioning protein
VARVLAVVNQKGGVGKTTTAVSTAAALAIAERRTLLIDADPQANATRALGFDPDPERASLYDAVGGAATLQEVELAVDGLSFLTLVPSDGNLFGAEVELVEAGAREYRLKSLIEPARPRFDYILVDCPPSLGLLTVNALTAADGILIPVQCEYLALEGITQLMDTVGRIRSALNPELEIAGLLMTMYDDRTNLSRQVVEEVREVFSNQVFQTLIPRNVRLGEAPSYGKPIFAYDIRSKGAEAYLNAVKELLDHEEKGVGQGAPQPDPGGAGEETVGDPGDAVGPAAGRERAARDRPRPHPSQPQAAARDD